MKYFLWLAAIGSHARLPLTREEFEGLTEAWRVITALLPFEEEFDGVLQNYIDLELGFLSTAMKDMIISKTDLKEYRKVRIQFSRLLSNLLSSCRAYFDHTPHHLSSFGELVQNSFDDKRKTAHKEEFAYRFMEALRNYAQHRGSPLHGTTFNTRRVERGDEKPLFQYSVWASIKVEELRADKKFNRTVLSEISNEEWVDVLAMSRIYIEKIGEIHSKMRSELADRVNDAKTLLRGAIDRYEKETGQGRMGIAFARSTSDRTVDEYHPIPEDIIDLYDDLVSQNRHVTNLRRRFVSNELLPEREGSLGRR